MCIRDSLYGGETGCSYGCLGCGDCVAACQFAAIHMNPETGLPEVDEEKCTACGACAKACPKSIIEIRPQGKKSRRIYVQLSLIHIFSARLFWMVTCELVP